MSRETRICQNCKNQFTIESEDFDFYKKIDVPPPTWCPECRMVRRFLWRNERILYRGKCELCQKNIISMYPPHSPFVVYCHDCWWSDKWDPTSYGRKYNTQTPFFEQLKQLFLTVPRIALQFTNATNSTYVNHTLDIKNGYLVFGGHDNEDLYYSNQDAWVKNSFDVSFCEHSELCYEAFQCDHSSNLRFSVYSSECLNSAFLLDCRNCQECFLCGGLRNKKFCFKNKQYSKDEYLRLLNQYNLGSYTNFLKAKEEFKRINLIYPMKFGRHRNAINSTGDDLLNVKNCRDCFASRSAEDCAYSFFAVDEVKDAYDVVFTGIKKELIYETISGLSNKAFFTHRVWYSDSVRYSDDCFSGQDLFGCVSLRNKHYCILNKQYTKEEYEKLIPRIIEHMNKMPYVDKQGRVYKYGEFFPPELSPFAYNETIAQEYFPLTKDEAITQGYRWQDPEKREYEITKKPEDLPDHIKDVDDSILKETIQCAHNQTCNEQCTQAFKIIPEELQFYKRMNLPLPRLCPNCRHYQRLKQRNPLKLWHRKCQCTGQTSKNKVYQNTATHQHGAGQCPNEFETSYSPERKEIVYCESCYNSEVV